jgi:alkylation response protein AidB-like acyl-CoA dehydrogenase
MRSWPGWRIGVVRIPFSEEYGGADGGYEVMCWLWNKSPSFGRRSYDYGCPYTGLGAISAFGTEEQKKKYMIPGCKGKHIVSFAFTEREPIRS